MPGPTVFSPADFDRRRPDTWPAFLTIEEAARILRVKKSSAYEMATTGTLPTVRFSGRSIRVPRGALAALAGEQVVSTPAGQAADQRESAAGGAPRHAANPTPNTQKAPGRAAPDASATTTPPKGSTHERTRNP